MYYQQASKAIKLRNLGQRERNMHAKAGESDRAIRVKKVLPPMHMHLIATPNVGLRSRNICFLANGRRARRADVDSQINLVGWHSIVFTNPRDDTSIDILTIFVHGVEQPQNSGWYLQVLLRVILFLGTDHPLGVPAHKMSYGLKGQ